MITDIIMGVFFFFFYTKCTQVLCKTPWNGKDPAVISKGFQNRWIMVMALIFFWTDSWSQPFHQIIYCLTWSLMGQFCFKKKNEKVHALPVVFLFFFKNLFYQGLSLVFSKNPFTWLSTYTQLMFNCLIKV